MADLDADTIVIGSGSGGLTTGLALANAGMKVLVLEQHYTPGGWCHNFSKDGYTFCPGVHYIGRLGEGGETRRLYEGLGIANDLVFFEQNPDAYEHCYINDIRFDHPNNLPALTERLKERFPNERKGISNYMELLQNLVDQLPLIFDVSGIKDVITMPYRTRHIGRYGLFSLKHTLESRINDPVLRAILSVQCGDQGLPPAKTMMMLHAGLARHYAQGGFYPKGGGGSIAWSMVRGIKRAGGKVKVGQRVEKILIEQQISKRRAIGVRTADGREYRSRFVVSNADPNRTYLGMVGREYLSNRLQKRLARTRYSLSSLHLFLAININPRELGLDSGNIWYSKTTDLDAVFQRVLDPRLYEQDEFEALFVSAPTLKDPTGFNGKAHTLEVVTFVGYDAFKKFERSKTDARDSAYTALKEKIRAMFMKTLRNVIPNLESYVVFSDLGTPLTNTHYIESTLGSVYGTEKNYGQIGPFAFKANTEIEGLKLTGASTVSHGVSGAAMSGINAAASILDCRWQSLLNAKDQHLRVYSAEEFGI